MGRSLTRELRPELLERRVLLASTPIGPEFNVNTYTNSFQDTSSVAMNAAGDFVVTWTSDGQDGSGYGVYVQRYNASGNKNGTEFLVNTTTTNWQMESAVAISDAGDFVVTWSSAGQDGGGFGIYAQRFDAAGVPQGTEFRVNNATAGDQRYSTVAMDASGDFVVTWTSTGQDGGGDGIYARLYSSGGGAAGNEFLVNTNTTGDQRYSSVAIDSDGDFVVTWKSDLQDGDGYGVYAQRFNASGAAQLGEIPVNTYTDGHQIEPTVAMDDNGNFVISWTSWHQDTSENGIYARRYSSAGTALGGEFKVNSHTLSNQEYSSAAMDADGDFVISWQSRGQDPGGSAGIYAQRYTETGVAQDDEFQVNLSTSFDQINPALGMDASGNFVVVWESPDIDQLGVYAQRFLMDGPVQLDGTTLRITGTSVADVIDVISIAGGSPSLNVIRKGVTFAFDPARISAILINGLGGNDVLTVNNNVALPSRLYGGTGSDILAGGSGDDQLTGGDGSDSISGGLGNDLYIFTAATLAEADQVNESIAAGTDTLTFNALSSAVSLSLGSTAVQSVHTNRSLKLNSVVTFENIVGGSNNDVLFGNALANTLTGNAGNDRLDGRAGNDSILGGLGDDTYTFLTASTAEADTVTESGTAGTDTLTFSALSSAVSLSLGSTAVQSVHINRSLKLNSTVTFENIVGGSNNDVLFGNTLANTLTGNAGNDRLDGRAGNDSILGGLGDDTYTFLTASTAEADTVTESGTAGTDTLTFSTLSSAVSLSLASTAVQTVHANRTLILNSEVHFENAVGGAADDILIGNFAANILVGNAGNDQLNGESGRDILIGGLGLDTLVGGNDDDVLIAGLTASDAQLSKLIVLQTEWLSINDYAIRIANLRSGVGAPTVSLKAKVNVLTDVGDDDVLTGGAGTDWFFKAIDDIISDLLFDEIIDTL